MPILPGVRVCVRMGERGVCVTKSFESLEDLESTK